MSETFLKQAFEFITVIVNPSYGYSSAYKKYIRNGQFQLIQMFRSFDEMLFYVMK